MANTNAYKESLDYNSTESIRERNANTMLMQTLTQMHKRSPGFRYVCWLLFYAIATIFQLYSGGDVMYEMRRSPSLHLYQLKESLTSHTI